MDDLEFRKKAIISPRDQSPEFLDKIKHSAHKRRFVAEQQHFNQQLSEALHVSVPENLAERIILAQQLTQHKLQRKKYQRIRWLGGIAASFILAISISFILAQTFNQENLGQQIITHVLQDTHALNVDMHIPKSHIDTMLASYGGKLNGPIGQVSFLGHCIIGGKTGVHMVLKTNSGLVTVLLLPTQTISNSYALKDVQYTGIVYPSRKGSIAIIAERPDAISATRQHIDQNLNWLI